MDKKPCLSEISTDGCEKLSRPTSDMTSPTHGHFDQEKRVRREIANSNERRRMQSINAGFDSLRILLPTISDGEKMSKATILQLTAKKRKSDDLKKRPDCIRSRRRRVETDGTFDSTRQNYIHFSPESTDTHQSSPLNSFNSSTSICSASPQLKVQVVLLQDWSIW
ncbi:unnamed protein product [Heterobilharzia americana]|nr:unnamed protein product [Heterobilharzia americana]